MKNKRLFAFIATATLILLIPFIGNIISEEVNWDVFDFIVAATLLYTAAITLELIIRNIRQFNKRMFAIIILAIILLLTWAELAVGVFGSPFAGN